jgi:hypothetical protein
LAVIIPGSSERPHFAGRSYIRLGSETREASEEQFAGLVAERTSIGREIRQNIGRTVKVFNVSKNTAGEYSKGFWGAKILDCNSYCVFLEPRAGEWRAIPLRQIVVSYESPDQLVLEQHFP